ncbi:MAG: DUF4276 family protein [Gammaproteobacteria bacterium]
MHLILLVEDYSTEVFLGEVLPKVAPGRAFKIHSFRGKTGLLRKLESRLRGYAKWLPDDCRLIVLLDRDAEDCRQLKQKLETTAGNVGLFTRAAANVASNAGRTWQLATRIAIEETEAWYFGDWQAVCDAYPSAPKTMPRKAGYRNPDAIKNTWEALERILQRGGYFSAGLNKIEAAKKIGAEIDPARNQSRSFQKFCEAVSE